MHRRNFIALMCLATTIVQNVNAQNGEEEEKDMRIIVNNTDFSVNKDLTSYFNGQTPSPVEKNEPYDSYYVTPVAEGYISHPLEFQFGPKNYRGKAFVFKEHCYIMKIDSSYKEQPYLMTRYDYQCNGVIELVAIEDATGDTITSQKFYEDTHSIRVPLDFTRTYIDKLIRLDITTYGKFPEDTNGLRYFSIRPTFNGFDNHFKVAYMIPDTEYNEYSGVNNLSGMSKDDEVVTVYDAMGHVIRTNVKKSSSLVGLKNGIYIVNGKKVILNNK